MSASSVWVNRAAESLRQIAAYAFLYLGTAGQVAQPWLAFIGAAHALLLLAAYPAMWQRNYVLGASALVAVTVAFYLQGWAIAAWLCTIAGIVLGRLLASHGMLRRLAGVMQVLLCLALLFFAVLPGLVAPGAALLETLGMLVAIFFVCSIVATVLAGIEPAEFGAEPIVSALFALFCGVLSLSVAVIVLGDQELGYLPALLTVLVAGSVVAGLGWIVWYPGLGGGLSTAFFRHLLSLSMPLDVWMRELAELTDKSADADSLWKSAMELLVEKTDLTGISWMHDEQEVLVGSYGRHTSRLALPEMGIDLHVAQHLLPSRSFNFWLLARVAVEFRTSKEREARLSMESTMRSIHELGARTTHDLKNLLHAIVLLCSPSREHADEGLDKKKREQLLLLAGRLETAMSQLKGKSLQATGSGLMPVRSWWDGAMRRHRHGNINFVVKCDINSKDLQVPADLFDRALENLLHNALRKQVQEGELNIGVELDDGPSLTVRDNGSPIPDAMASKLFVSPLPSGEGMGIGLYQLGTSAVEQGYRIFVSENSPGQVAVTIEKG